MAEHIQKKAKYEKTEEEMPSLEAENELIPSDRSQEEEERSRMTTNSINYLNTLRSREICVTGKYSRKVPNIFRDYHLEAYGPVVYHSAPYFVLADEIIFVIFNSFEIYPCRRNGEFSPIPYKDKYGLKKIKFDINMTIEFAYYNSNNNSLILVATSEVDFPDSTVIVSLQIEPIKAGLRTEHTNICPQDGNMIGAWDFDIPNCRGMVYNMQERLFKVFEMKKYTPLFTIPREGDDSLISDLRFGSPGNMEFLVMMYHKDFAREEVSLRIYSKHTGQLRKRISVPVNPQYSIKRVELCGTDTILLQQSQLGMQIVDISAQISEVIKTTDIVMVGCPYYLCKRNLFLCCSTERRGVTGLHVFNLQGEIVVTFQDHPLLEPNLLLGSHIPSAEDIVISICHDKDATKPDLFKINISSIVTGECIGRITAEPSDYIELRESALESMVPCSFAYNETTHEIFTGNELGEIFIWSNKAYEDIHMDS